MPIDTFLRDVRFGLRMMRKSPAFTAVAVFTLALGIGASTTMFTAANDYLLRPLPFSNSGRIVMVKQYNQKLTYSGWVDPPTFAYWRQRNTVFRDMAAWSEPVQHYNLTGPEGAERVSAKQVSISFFRVLGVQPVLGRTFSEDDDGPDAPPVALVSHSLWRGRYGLNPNVLGKTILLNGQGYIVVGVLPPAFRFSTTPEQVWTPLTGLLDDGRGSFFLNVVASLKPNVTTPQAEAELATLSAQLAQQFPDSYRDQRVSVEDLRRRYAGELRPALFALLSAAGLILLIACANLANLLLARASTRQKEIAVRRALGGHRIRVIRQLLVESSLLAFLGGLLGLLFAFAGNRMLFLLLPAAWQPLTHGGMDVSVLLFALSISSVAALLFGLAPAWNVTGLDLNECLKGTRRSPLVGASRQLFRSSLLVGQVALAMFLLVASALLIESFVRLSSVDMGFRSENVLTVRVVRDKGDWTARAAFFADLLDRVSALPQVRAAGAINILPLSSVEWTQDIAIEGRPPRSPGDLTWAAHRQVSRGYFRAMSIPLLRGRSFVSTDRDKAVAVISKTMARQYWPSEDPIGKRFAANCSQPPCNWTSIIGVVADVKELGAVSPPATAMYFLESTTDMTLVMRSAQDPTRLATDIRAIIHSVDPNQPVADVRTMAGLVSESVAPQRFTVLIAALFAAFALLLAAVGIYGVFSCSVAERVHEFGIRMSLGANPQDILKLVQTQAFQLTLAGVLFGIFAAVVFGRFLSTLLYGVNPTNATTIILVSLLLLFVAILSSYIPARRAMRVDPSGALRQE